MDGVSYFLTHNCQYIAGAISFYMLFSMFPLVLAIISIWGFFLPTDMQQADMAERIAQALPISSDFIAETMRGVASARTITGIASVLGLIWASSTAFGAIRKGINTAWGVTRTRPFIRERLIDMGLASSAGVLMLFFMFLTPAVSAIMLLIELEFPDVDYDFLSRTISMIVSPTVAFVSFLLMYRYLPNTRVTFRGIWLGALIFSVAFEAAKWGFIWYVNTFPVYNALYGSVGAVVALLMWIYVSAIILLFGALATSRYARYAESLGGEIYGLRLIWTAPSRVKVKVVESSEPSA